MTITDIDRSLAVLAAARTLAEDAQDADGWIEAQERLDALLDQRLALTQRVDSGVAPVLA